MAPSSKKAKISRSTRAGLIFPISRIEKKLKSIPTGQKRISSGASIYLTSVIEYLVAELLELSGNVARDFHRTRIMPRHILLGYMKDDELFKLLRHCVLPQSGVLPRINLACFQNMIGKTSKTSTKTTPRPSTIHKPKLTKTGQGSFTILDVPKPKAAAVKATGVTTLSERILVRGQKLTVVQGSIVNITADAFVHPTNDSFYMGGEVGKALTAVGGQQLRDVLAETAKKHTITNPGDVTISSAPNLSTSHLIHVHSPKWKDTAQDECIGELKKAILNILTFADEKGLTSIALPSISSGRAGFPKQTAAQTILAALSAYFRQTATTHLQQVFFVLYDPESVNIYTAELQRMVE